MPKHDFHDYDTLWLCFKFSHVVVKTKVFIVLMTTRLNTMWLITFTYHMIKGAIWHYIIWL
jgi:hypothetical protein